MVEEIARDFYRIPIPLPGSLLGSVNAYVVKGPERSLIVDPGMNDDLCMQAMDEGLRRIGVDAARSDFFITHAHPDHFPLVSRLLEEGSVIYINKKEADVVETVWSGTMLAILQKFARLAGFPDDDLREILPPDVTRRSGNGQAWPFRFVKDADPLSVGDYRFRCIATPGHSLGHTCLYDPASRLLLAGDHILNDITPGIQARVDTDDPLRNYLQSLDKLYPLDIRLVLPGHRQPFTRFRERIDELKEHHRARALEIMAELENGGKNPYEIASAITWNVVDADSWGAAPDVQKLMATSETFAHLKYLEGNGVVRREVCGERFIFSLARTVRNGLPQE